MAVFYASDLAEAGGFQNVAPSPRVNGRLRLAVRTQAFVVANVDEIGDILLLASIPSSATILSAEFSSLAQGAAGRWDFGFCDRGGGNASPSGTDSRERLANSVDVSSAIGYTDRRFTSFAQATVAQRLWELLGFTSDPAREWFLCIRVEAVGASPTGTIDFRLRYVND